VPTLVVIADADEAVPDLTAKMTDSVEEGRIDMMVVEGADHMFMDLFLFDVADAAVEFFGW